MNDQIERLPEDPDEELLKEFLIKNFDCMDGMTKRAYIVLGIALICKAKEKENGNGWQENF